MRLFSLPFGLCLALTFLACNKNTALVNNPSSAQKSYLALGDSYTIGEGVQLAENFPNRLSKALRDSGIAISNPDIVATTGWTTDELIQGITARQLRSGYDLVTLLIGVNNQYRGRSLENYRSEFADLLTTATRLAKGGTAGVVVVSIPDYSVTPFAASSDTARIAREIDTFNEAAQTLAASRGIAFVNITPLSRLALTDRTLLAADGLHPSGKMYGQWVQLLLPVARLALR